jgi:parvulin-like peptidyl-prolyl isomerase
MAPLSLVVATLWAFGACARGTPVSPDAIAQVAGTELLYGQFQRYVASTAGDQSGVLDSTVLSQLFDQFLDEELLARSAFEASAEQGGDASEETATTTSLPESSILRRRAIEALLDREVQEPSEADVAAYYRDHAEQFKRPQRVRLRQILVEDRAVAEKVAAELAAGADFGASARGVSREPSASLGGFQGELAKADLPKAFADLIFALEPGQTSGVVQAEYGFHIFRVDARLPAETLSLDAARDEIRDRLRGELADRRLAELVAKARGRYNVEVYARNLPFDYRGAYLDPDLDPDGASSP